MHCWWRAWWRRRYTPALAEDDQGRGRNRASRSLRGSPGTTAATIVTTATTAATGTAARYYQNDERRAQAAPAAVENDRIYRGSDNLYYCEHDDGTTGLIVGAMAGGVLGNIIAPGSWKTVGTILGAGGGALPSAERSTAATSPAADPRHATQGAPRRAALPPSSRPTVTTALPGHARASIVSSEKSTTGRTSIDASVESVMKPAAIAIASSIFAASISV